MEPANEIERIESDARAAKITLKALCSRAGIAQSTLTRAKRGAVEPRWSTVQKLETALAALIAEAGAP